MRKPSNYSSVSASRPTCTQRDAEIAPSRCIVCFPPAGDARVPPSLPKPEKGAQQRCAAGDSRRRPNARRLPAPNAALGGLLAQLGHGSPAGSGTASVTSVGARPFSIVSRVTTHFVTSRREGSSNWTSSSVSSRIERRPRAPVSRSSALSAIAPSESSAKTSSMSSNSKKRWNCRVSALRRLGQDRDQVVAGELVDRGDHRQAADELGDQAVLHEVLGQHLLEQLADVLALLVVIIGRRSRRPLLPMRRSITLSSSANEPPQMKRMLVVSIVRNSWWGCLRPALRAAPRRSCPRGSSAAPAGRPRRRRRG